MSKWRTCYLPHYEQPKNACALSSAPFSGARLPQFTTETVKPGAADAAYLTTTTVYLDFTSSQAMASFFSGPHSYKKVIGSLRRFSSLICISRVDIYLAD